MRREQVHGKRDQGSSRGVAERDNGLTDRGAATHPNTIMQLQKIVGNQAIMHMLRQQTRTDRSSEREQGPVSEKAFIQKKKENQTDPSANKDTQMTGLDLIQMKSVTNRIYKLALYGEEAVSGEGSVEEEDAYERDVDDEVMDVPLANEHGMEVEGSGKEKNNVSIEYEGLEDSVREEDDEEEGPGYLDILQHSVDTEMKVAFIVNSICSYQDVEQIPQVVEAILANLDGREFGDRIAIVLGMNAPESQQEDLDRALAQAQTRIDGLPVPVAVVGDTFKGKFPYGQMRNNVMHSEESRALMQHFLDRGYHPYVSIQDFDTGSRYLPDGQTHIFEELSERLTDIKPLMVAGGYRPGPDLIEKIAERFMKEEKTIPGELLESDYFQKFQAHILKDMIARDEYAKIHPLLPYSPEPNLFLDGLPILMGEEEDTLFGQGAAEFSQLAKGLGRLESKELSGYFGPLYKQAAKSIPIAKTERPELNLDEYDDEVEIFAEEDDSNLAIAQDQEEIYASLRIAAQTGQHPIRGMSFMTGYRELSVETDLSRLAKEQLETGKDPQDHYNLTGVTDRYFDSKPAKKGVSFAQYNKNFDGKSAKAKDAYREGIFGPFVSEEDGEMVERPDPKFFKPAFLGNRRSNVLSEALSSSLNGPFSDETRGIDPEHKLFASHAVSTALSEAIEKIMFLLKLKKQQLTATPLDGNCLYHAVIQALTGTTDLGQALELRRQVVDWMLSDQNLPVVSEYAFQHGVSIDSLVLTISQNGNWSGNPGDLVPRIIASALGRTIVITVDDSNTVAVPPLNGGGGSPIQISLDTGFNHYFVPGAHVSASDDGREEGASSSFSEASDSNSSVASEITTNKDFHAIYFDGRAHMKVLIPGGTLLRPTKRPTNPSPNEFYYALVLTGSHAGKEVRFLVGHIMQ